MGTSNFYYKNMLAVIDLREIEEKEEDNDLIDYIIEGVISNIQTDLDNVNLINVSGWKDDTYIDNYPISNNFGGKRIYKLQKETKDYIMNIEIILYHGYYTSVNIDYTISYEGININDEEAEEKADNKTNSKLINKVINIIKKCEEKFKTNIEKNLKEV